MKRQHTRPSLLQHCRRAMDILMAAACLLMVAPLLMVTAAAILLTDGRPVFFRQNRIGQHGRPFPLWKFRSMRNNDLPMDGSTEVGNGHPLVTPVGSLMRRYKIDELPQLLNILIGDMAVVGPRPTIQEQVERYNWFQSRRLEVRPGLSGLSQVSGGIKISWSERIMLDVWYVDHQSIWLDTKILLRTVLVVLFGDQRNETLLQQARKYARAQGAPDGSAVDFSSQPPEVTGEDDSEAASHLVDIHA